MFCLAQNVHVAAGIDLHHRAVSRSGKGCDIGYALAASSCEGANNVEHAPSQPFDAITAFAVPNPNWILADQSVFSGLVALQVALPS